MCNYFFKCKIIYANVSRLGCGNSDTIWHKAGAISCKSSACIALVNSGHKAKVTSGSLSDRRKSLTVPQIT